MNIEEYKRQLRQAREVICFPVVNRGKLWYECLSFDQLAELRTWYQAWLDVTNTLMAPDTPKWINDHIVKEEVLL